MERINKLLFGLLLATHAAFVLFGYGRLLDDAIALIVTGLACVCTGVSALQRRRDGPLFQPDSMAVLVGAAAAMAVMTLLTYLYYGRLLEDYRHVLWVAMTLGMVMATGLTVSTRLRLHLLLMAFLLPSLLASVAGLAEKMLYDPLPGDPPAWQRVDGFTSLAVFGYLICITVPMTFATFLYWRNLGIPRLSRSRECILYLVWVAVLLGLTGSLIGNGSRGAMAGAVAGMLVAAAFSLRYKPARWHAILVGTLMGAFGLFLLYSQSLFGFVVVREGNHVLRSLSSSIESRIGLAGSAIESVLKSGWPIDPYLVPGREQQAVVDSPGPVISVEETEVDGQPVIRLTARPPAAYRSFSSVQWYTKRGDEEAFVRLPGEVDSHLVVMVPPCGRQALELWAVYEEGVFGRSPRIIVRRKCSGAVEVEVLGIRSSEGGISLATHQPHNQLLATLWRYGFLGAALLMVFYGTVAVTLARSVLTVWTATDARTFLPVAVVASGVVAYWVIGLLHPTTPFTDHWYFGFLFACAPLVVRRCETEETGIANDQGSETLE